MANKKSAAKAKSKKNAKSAAPAMSKKTKIIIAITAVVVVLALVASVVLSVMQSTGYFLRYKDAYQIGDETLSVADYNYYYYTSYNNFLNTYDEETLTQYGLDISEDALPLTQQYISEQYLTEEQMGSTWDSYFRSVAENSIKNTYAAVKLSEQDDSFSVTDNDYAIVEEYIQTIRDHAEQEGVSFREHLKNTFGPGVTEDILRKHNMKSQIAYSYNVYVSDNYEVTDEQINSVYAEFSDSLDMVTYRSYYVTSSTGSNSSDNQNEESQTETPQPDDTQANSLQAENQSYQSESAVVANQSYSGNAPKVTFMSETNSADNISEEELAEMMDDLLGGVTIDGINGESHDLEVYQGAEDDNAIEVEAARAVAEKLIVGVQTEEDFKQMVLDSVNPLVKDQYLNSDLTLHENEFLTNLSIIDAKDWLSSTARQPGDIGIVDSEAGVYIVYFISRDANTEPTVNFRDIMIQPTTEVDASTGITEDQLTEARAYAEEILKEWESGDKTEDRFSLLATQYSADTYTNANGGLYAAYYAGQGYPEMDEWLFSEDRQEGDTTIVDGDYGAYILYFINKGDEYWREQCKSYVISNASGELISEQIESMETQTLAGYTQAGIQE